MAGVQHLLENGSGECDGKTKFCKNNCYQCTLFCSCACAPHIPGIVAFSIMLTVFIVLLLITWYSNWYQKPIENVRNYFREYRNTFNAEPLIKNNSS
ncbi:hypothetical protein BBBOND_0102720 [Babesia bigemina]|uniref:Uncharacterized protein n=1 Tax=Babesia bigemina TaxID=5866 RepID=A0A061D890_BABBI|nr:hypothetical protein BBBOND_0102720 [Babesia bigemina]CDR93945.1 hypothetical protein BBBOND_0102720 [Babesia bigemina]|eukprot:XP_012766131.1 hypothetical protein BBBOND_0102720 [Babesia bigemina]